jgi:hypothetical protein
MFDTENIKMIAMPIKRLPRGAEGRIAVQTLAGNAGLLSQEPAMKIIHRRYLAALRQEMDPAELERAWQEGQGMSLEEALRAGLEIQAAAVDPPADDQIN